MLNAGEGQDGTVPLHVDGLSKRFGATRAVSGVTFQLRPAEIVALLGPNGAGKSTIIKCIAGLLRADHGTIRISGHPNRTEAANANLGYLPEIPAVYELLTVWEHLAFIARAYRQHAWHDRAHELLERFALDGKVDSLGSQLSKGMRQKLLIACALLHQPRLLLFDEPMTGLDPQAQRELVDAMARLRTEGCTLLVSTHMLGSIEQLADRAIILHQGQLLGTGTPDELRNQYSLPAHTPLEDVFLHATARGSDER